MNVQVVQLDPIYLVIIRHRGPYEAIGKAFDQLTGWAQRQGLPMKRMIGIYWDNPDFVEASQLRSAAGVEVWHGYQITNAAELPLELHMIPGGSYATTRYVGPYEDLGPVWTDFTASIENKLKYTISEDPAFEVYVNDPSDTPPQELITDLYMPIA